MQKEEFEKLIEHTVPDELYKIVETVYMWHPSIGKTVGKEQIAFLYNTFGMRVFFDMLPRAKKNMRLEKELQSLQNRTEIVKKAMMFDFEKEYEEAMEVNG